MLPVTDLPAAFMQTANPDFINELCRWSVVGLAAQLADGNLMELGKYRGQDCLRNLTVSARIALQLLGERIEVSIVPRPTVLAADTLTGYKLVNFQKEDLGKIEHWMIDLEPGPSDLCRCQPGGTSSSSLLVTAHKLSPSGQNWTARTEIVLPHLNHGNQNDSRIS